MVSFCERLARAHSSDMCSAGDRSVPVHTGLLPVEPLPHYHNAILESAGSPALFIYVCVCICIFETEIGGGEASPLEVFLLQEEPGT